jgi:transposase
MPKPAESLPEDPAELRAMIVELQVENAKMAATLRVHDQLVQALRLRIAKLQKLAFGKSSEKIEREIPSRDIAAQYPAGQWNSWNWHWKIC